MGMTIAEKILAAHAGVPAVKPGEIHFAKLPAHRDQLVLVQSHFPPQGHKGLHGAFGRFGNFPIFEDGRIEFRSHF